MRDPALLINILREDAMEENIVAIIRYQPLIYEATKVPDEEEGGHKWERGALVTSGPHFTSWDGAQGWAIGRLSV